MKFLNAEDHYHNFMHPELSSLRPLESVVCVINDHCNLNCARCSHFSPLAESNIVDKEKYSKDLIQLAKITKDHPIKYICIMGGEPLLNPDITYYLDFIANLFPSAYIFLTTNGILLHKMDDNFWNVVNKYKNIFINISKYFENSFYDKIKNILIEKKFSLENLIIVENKELESALFINFQLRKEGYGLTQKELFSGCKIKNAYVQLRDGKIYTCQIQADIHILENYFHEGFDDCLKYGINIYENSYEKIIEYLENRAHEGCKYCCPDAYNALYFPEPSKKERSEWIKD